MIQSFADQTTVDLFNERPSRAARRIPRDLWPVVGRKLKLLDVAQRLSDLASPPGNRLEGPQG
jgi:plasmid maintenance system killer protein